MGSVNVRWIVKVILWCPLLFFQPSSKAGNVGTDIIALILGFITLVIAAYLYTEEMIFPALLSLGAHYGVYFFWRKTPRKRE